MKRSIAQQAALDLIADIHEHRIAERASLRRRIEEQLRDKLIDLEIRESRAANEAVALGLSVTAVGRAMGTSNWNTIKAILARTEGQVTAADIAAANAPQRFTIVGPPEDRIGAKVRVTMEGDDWEKFVKRNKHRFRRQQFADETEIVVDVVAGGQPSYPGRLGDNDLSTVNMYDHPIMGWLKYGPGKDEFVAWLLQHPEALGEAQTVDDDNEDDYEEDE